MEKIDENSKNNMHTCNSIFTQPLKTGVNKKLPVIITVSLIEMPLANSF